MVKKLIQDININKAKSRDIAFTSYENMEPERPIQNTAIREHKRRSIPRTPRMKNDSMFSGWIFKVLIFLIIITALYFISIFFQKATVIIEAKSQEVNLVDEVFSASKNNPKNPNFEIMILSDSLNKDIKFNEKKNVSLKARGSVILKNEYSTKPQKIAVNTRLVDDYGHIYTTNTAVTIPGFTKGSSGVVPGSVEVGITAVGVGDMYNTDSKAFLIQGFQKTDKYTKIYAKSSVPITGGAEGDMYSLDPVELGKIQAEANSILRDQLLRKLSAQIPEGYILYPSATEYTSSFDSGIQSKTKEGSIEISGTVNAIIIKRSDLESFIVKRILPNTKDSEYTQIHIADLQAFAFNFSESSKHITKDLTDVSFRLSGKSTLFWKPNIESIKTSIVGLPMSDVSDVAKKDPGVIDVSIKFRFPWQKNLPMDLSKIDIESN